MAEETLKLYQLGTFAVGNRLLDPDERTVQAGRERSNTLTSGHRACQGCGEALGARYVLDAAMRATAGRLIAANATGCLEVFSTPYPESSWQLPWLHSLFGNAPAVGAGIAAALKAKGRTDIRVVAQGGDGGTLDIGFACLSGHVRAERRRALRLLRQRGVHEHRRPALERDATRGAHGQHEAGRRRAGERLRPGQERAADRDGARDPVRRDRDRRRPPRPRAKIERAMEFRGARYVHVLVPCPLGWGSAAADTIRIARLAQETGPLPGLRGRARRGRRASRRSAARSRSRSTCGRSVASPTSSASRRGPTSSSRSRRAPTATSAASACSRRQVMEKPFAITLDVGSSLANKTGSWRTERPVYVHQLPPCANAARRARTSSNGSTTPRRAAPATSAPGGRSWRTTPSRP